MRGRRKPCAAGPQEDGRHAVSRINSMKIAKGENNRYNISAVRKRLKTVSQRKGVDFTKSFCFHPI